jgi:hypothetical protein
MAQTQGKSRYSNHACLSPMEWVNNDLYDCVRNAFVQTYSLSVMKASRNHEGFVKDIFNC